jgi:DNA polymerase-3 subunit epsilon
MRYAALDLECATSDTGNICEVGVVLMENGQEVGRYRSLVRPVVESFGDWQRWNFDYGLKDTLKAPAFPAIWEEVKRLIGDAPVVAHNAGVVECKHLGHAFSFHGLDAATGPVFHCTLELAKGHWTKLPKHGIKHVARHFQWKLDHHNPESDARICAGIVEEVAKEQGTDSWDAMVTSNQWTAHRIPQYQGRIKIAAKPTDPRTRADYAHELIAWKPTVPLVQMAPGLRFILSGFDHAAKSKLREAGIRKGLHYKRYIKGGIDFLVADAKMGVSKYATCVEKQIPILSEAEFKAALKAMQP